MKKILLSFCLLFSVIIVSAQSQSDLDKAMKQMEEMMKNMTPEEQEMVKQYTKGLPTSVNDMKNTKPAVNNTKQTESKASDIGTKTAKTIGPEGGEIKSANGKITLKFPASAVSKKTEISIEEIGNDLETGSGNAFQLLPEGIEFIEPVTLVIKYTDEEIEGSMEDDLFITTRGKNNEILISLLSKVDTIANTITTEINHFSKWGMCTRLKVKLVPEEKTLNKGQSVDLEVQRWEIMPVDIEKKEALLKELYEKEKKYEENSKKEYNEFINSLVSQKNRFEEAKYTPTRDIDALGEKLIHLRKRTTLIVKKIVDGAVNKELELDRIKKELGLPIDDLLTILEVKKTIETTKLSIIDWKLNNTKAPVSNSFGSLTPNGFNAKYTAPKLLPTNNRDVKVTVTLLGKEDSEKPYKFKLASKIILNDENYLNYTLDGKTTNTLQLGVSSTFIKNMQQDAKKTMNQAISQCFLVDGELIISTMSNLKLAENLNSTDEVYFKIKNPIKGQNFVKCDDQSSSFRDDTRISVQTGVKGEQFVNSQHLRWYAGNMCDGRENCVPFEFNLTEYNPVNGGTVSGTFSGKVYDDKDMAKNCSNSIEHFISGEFSLSVQMTPGEDIDPSLPASKPATTKSKTPPPPPPPLTPEEIAKMSGTPPPPPPPLTPAEIKAMDKKNGVTKTTSVKPKTPPPPPPPLTPEEIVKMNNMPPSPPPALTPAEIAAMNNGAKDATTVINTAVRGAEVIEHGVTKLTTTAINTAVKGAQIIEHGVTKLTTTAINTAVRGAEAIEHSGVKLTTTTINTAVKGVKTVVDGVTNSVKP